MSILDIQLSICELRGQELTYNKTGPKKRDDYPYRTITIRF